MTKKKCVIEKFFVCLSGKEEEEGKCLLKFCLQV